MSAWLTLRAVKTTCLTVCKDNMAERERMKVSYTRRQSVTEEIYNKTRSKYELCPVGTSGLCTWEYLTIQQSLNYMNSNSY